MGPGQRLPHQPQHPTHLITGHPDIAATGVDDPLQPNVQLRVGSPLGATSTAYLTTRGYCWTHLANGVAGRHQVSSSRCHNRSLTLAIPVDSNR